MLTNFPFEKPRPGVEQSMLEIKKAFDDGIRFVMVSAPTGSGKSSLAVWYARNEKSVIVTPTKLLQNQYASTKEFDQEYTVFGKSNYNCGLDGFTSIPVDEAICCSDAVVRNHADVIPWPVKENFWEQEDNPARVLKQKCTSSGTCPYYSLIAQIGRKPGAILNYDLVSHIKRNPDSKLGIDMGATIAMDEAHALLDKVRSVYGYTMSNQRAVRLLGDDANRQKREDPVDWLKRLASLALKEVMKEKQTKRAATLIKFHSRLDKQLMMDIKNVKKFHIDDDGQSVKIKPLDLRYLKETIFYPFKKVLLLSATFPDNYCELLGIEEKEVRKISIPSTFPKENRPVIFVRNCPPLNWKTELNDKHITIKVLEKILAGHQTDKGIIHCANYRMFGQLQKIYRRNPRFIWVERGSDKATKLQQHQRSKEPTVLVSPSMMEGVDLKDDLARFQVMLKLPFSALDDYTKKMIAAFPGYYENETITKIVQAYGRAVRSQEDKANFYILDGAFSRMMNNHRKLFSDYFLEALKVASL